MLEGLSCAACAGRIEKTVLAHKGVRAASVNMANATLRLEGDVLPGDLEEDVRRIIKQIEPEVRVSEKNGAERTVKRGWIAWSRQDMLTLLAGAAAFALGMVPGLAEKHRVMLFLFSYAILGWEVVWRALRNAARGRLFDENFLMTVATLGAFAIGEFAEAAGVMLFYQVGETLQQAAVLRSRKSIADLMDIRPDFANVERGGGLLRVSPESVGIGDVIVIRPGEKIPLDGRVLSGESMLDMAALTGETKPRRAREESEVLSGSVNLSGVLRVRVTKDYGESTATRIVDLVENSAAKKAPTENFITRFSRVYTPAVVGVAALLAVAPPLLWGAPWAEWMNRGLVFLVISCPCALVISIPLGFFGGIGGASKKGVLVKGGNYLEALSRVDTVVFDKTGTLTHGIFEVTGVVPADGHTAEEVLALAAHAEAHSGHPIAASIRRGYQGTLDLGAIAEVEEVAGQGVRARIGEQEVLVGSGRLMQRRGIGYEAQSGAATRVYVAVDGAFVGSIAISDTLKPDSAEAVRKLRALGVRHIAMLTGDHAAVAAETAGQLGIEEVYAELLPEDKVSKLEELEKGMRDGGKLVFVGDGINDAPVLARADIGVAMGGLGSDAAIEAADVVLMTDEPSRMIDAIRAARTTRRIVWQNILFAMGVKGLFLLLWAMGIARMWEAVFADVGVAVLAILNAMRAMRMK